MMHSISHNQAKSGSIFAICIFLNDPVAVAITIHFTYHFSSCLIMSLLSAALHAWHECETYLSYES